MQTIKIKRNTTNFLLVLFAILITARGNIIAISNITLVLVTILTYIIFYIRKEKFDRIFIYFSLIYFILLVLYVVKFHYIDFRGFREYIKIFYAYLVIKLVYRDFFRIYSNIIYYLALISIPLFILQLIDYDMMRFFIGIIDHNIPFLDYRDNWYENLFFFTLNDNGMFRNSGFAWEPKGFGTFLVLAMFFRLFLNGFRIIDRKIIVYLIAIITTFSTATYLVLFFVILPFYLYNKNVAIKFIAASITVPVIAIIFTQVSFLQDKIIHEFDTKDKFVNYVDDTKFDGATRSLGRFGSLIVDYRDWKKEPIIGYGMYSNERTMYSINGVKLVRVNGFSDYMAKYGILGLVFYFFYLLKSFKIIAKQFRFKGYYLIVIGILATSFSSAILLTPLYLSLVFYSFVKRK